MNGWDESAAAWIADMGDEGDRARRWVLDRPMLARIEGRGFRKALDVGCGEGRFCRLMQACGIATTGLDPTMALISEARCRDPEGVYVQAGAEAMPFPDASFDLVVSYLSLIDIPDYRTALKEMARVLAPGGAVLISNLSSLVTAGRWHKDLMGRKAHFVIDDYMTERSSWEEWRGIRIQNWHRPLSDYMAACLDHGLVLRHFAEPLPHNGDPEWVANFTRVPWFSLMDWQKPSLTGY